MANTVPRKEEIGWYGECELKRWHFEEAKKAQLVAQARGVAKSQGETFAPPQRLSVEVTLAARAVEAKLLPEPFLPLLTQNAAHGETVVDRNILPDRN
eukprot:465860-Prymnesium_polylepis.2